MSRTVFPPKRLSETKIYQFNFLSDLGPTEYVSSAAVAVTVYSGVDPSPSSLLSGITSESGSIVSQQILGGMQNDDLLGPDKERRCGGQSPGGLKRIVPSHGHGFEHVLRLGQMRQQDRTAALNQQVGQGIGGWVGEIPDSVLDHKVAERCVCDQFPPPGRFAPSGGDAAGAGRGVDDSYRFAGAEHPKSIVCALSALSVGSGQIRHRSLEHRAQSGDGRGFQDYRTGPWQYV